MNNIRIIKRAEVLGYCMGVRKAVDAVFSVIKQGHGNVLTYGPLIHNPATMRALQKEGVKILDPESFEPDSKLAGNTVIIRAHGISPEKRVALENSGARLVDATCPRVVSSQMRAKKHAEKGLPVILAGDKNHGELIGIAGYVRSVKGAQCFGVQNAEEAARLSFDADEAVLIAQTTIKQSEYNAIADVLRRKVKNLLVLNTICSATEERQIALKKLSLEVDAVLIIGGKNSANTQRLLQTAKDIPLPAWLVETAKDIPKEIYQFRSVGISAGASTPDFIIDQVEKALRETH
ncbi:4-hydroxy-3-methylbut-2-enyl diphosphate reductase [Treponema phagedenis]|uniref:4-hydroxy-3-methylbut-2-enyl diphosphate reductase n=1 Tax=Treponema phagedenis TaxID=162 RepID=A0A0B7GXB0_TREPH|nr:4-hydroxy-3-methylbut-2-enyl diphosphate reductase [Treponema phagedenis]NVP22935.1 4-hydroxy-3-methylbut-2-enyl diphosphate reductase [Treponema phagedenis]QEJ95056.1 4-hydroxy-3-methylbut-2-enyl diphosphate reductase [Treponema phagedenis]QEJ98270.1 4-hydroxy-3-methylbut-2-enyl diphosphate reductase [Treponema phagedenis]QEK00981.1 4-hydroxy-3-methylbut-2-enyl diphosphate reductase [Treponema phagedenis]QEK03781.1 4-hydroxy-3-methylbut-2-enyl diphosphate reductase [Treponema phagedenis]